MTFPLIDRVRRLAEKASGTAGRFEARELCTDAPALADVAEQALKALARIHEFAISAIEGGAYASDMLPLIDKEARRVLALAEKE